MDNLELLVHISAPATRMDDKRAVALTNGLLAFQPGRMTTVINSDVNFYDHEPAADAQTESTTLVTATGVNALKRKSKSISTDGIEPLKRLHEFKRTKTLGYQNVNPPYRNPFRTSESVRDEAPRPRTAPEDSLISDIQVPRTNSARRRAYSDPFEGSARILDSQEVQVIEESSEGRISSPLAQKYITTSFSQVSLSEKSSPDRMEWSPALTTRLTRKSTSLGSDPSTEAATASPSQPMEGIDGQRPYSSQPVPRKSPSIVTIASTPSQMASDASNERHGTSVQQSSQGSGPEDAASELQRPKLFPMIDNLSTEAVPPQPRAGEMADKDSSHINQRLAGLYKALSPVQMFRPLKVTRDIKNLERGHWLMEITIASDAEVAKARAQPAFEVTQAAHLKRFDTTVAGLFDAWYAAKHNGTIWNYDYGYEDDALGLWTEKEFCDFWNKLSPLIDQGELGWSVRMVRDEIASPLFDYTALHSKNVNRAGRRQMRVRIFHFGEVTAHMYLGAWSAAHMQSWKVPMKWIAADGEMVIIEMSGKELYVGKIGTLVDKGGCWGLPANSVVPPDEGVVQYSRSPL